ncbi:MAG: orotidine-5'-phosphate decarboxylase [Acidimicrobiia bacterium]
MTPPPVLVALDVPSAEQAVRLAGRLAPWVAGFKVGLELLMGPGPMTIAAVAELGKPVFADAKVHDIPTTAGRAARQLGRLGARWVTVHAAGGAAMVTATVEGLAEGAGGRAAGILAVTVLTSLTAEDLERIGVGRTPGRQVGRLAKLAADTGAEGVVCSVRELGDVAQVAPSLVRVTPGIRMADSPSDDQVRTATPAEALARGATYLVVGRPITAAADPEQAAARLAAELAAAAPVELVESPSIDPGRD